MSWKLNGKTVTVEEAATILGVDRNKAYEAARSGEIPTIRIGKRLLVPRAALERLLAVGANRSARMTQPSPKRRPANASDPAQT